jgi:hypothetical protein
MWAQLLWVHNETACEWLSPLCLCYMAPDTLSEMEKIPWIYSTTVIWLQNNTTLNFPCTAYAGEPKSPLYIYGISHPLSISVQSLMYINIHRWKNSCNLHWVLRSRSLEGNCSNSVSIPFPQPKALSKAKGPNPPTLSLARQFRQTTQVQSSKRSWPEHTKQLTFSNNNQF